jgi:hypothetical protein
MPADFLPPNLQAAEDFGTRLAQPSYVRFLVPEFIGRETDF